MRNLKRALSLALASIMLLGMMVVGSGAASYPDVDDEDNLEAIDVLKAVGVMVGDERGFRPDDEVNRAEMARIMADLMDLDYNYYEATPSQFTDVSGNYSWAKGYIDACAANGIIYGRGNGIYDPGAGVTALEAASMMMRALGYFQSLEDNTPDFETATVRQASRINLFDGVEGNVHDALDRNQVAQLALNTLEARMVDFTGDPGFEYNGVKVGYRSEYTERTSSQTKYNQIAEDGRLTDVDGSGQFYVQLGEQLYNGDLKKSGAWNGFNAPATRWSYKDTEIGTYVDDADYLLEGTVKSSKMYATVGKAVAEDYTWDVWMDGVENVDRYNEALFDGPAVKANNSEDLDGTDNGTYTCLYLDNRNNIVHACILNTYAAEVTKVADGKVTLNDEYGKRLEFETDDYDVDDVVLYTKYWDPSGDGTWVVANILGKAELVEGEATTVREGKYVVIDGKTYNYSAMYNDIPIPATSAGANVAIYLDLQGNIVYLGDAKENLDYALVLGVGRASSKYTGEAEYGAQMMLSDGTILNVDLDKDYTQELIDNYSRLRFAPFESEDTDLGKLQRLLVGQTVSYSKGTNSTFTLDYTDANGEDNPKDEYSDAMADIIENGRSSIKLPDGVNFLYANSNTVFVLNDTDDGETSYSVYTGYDNVPDVNAVAGTEISAFVNKGVAKVVYVTGGEVKGADSIVFVVGNPTAPANKTTEGNGSGTYYVYKAIVDGEATEISVKGSSAAYGVTSALAKNAIGAYSRVSKDSDGYVTKLQNSDNIKCETYDGTQKLTNNVYGFKYNETSKSYEYHIGPSAKTVIGYLDKSGTVTVQSDLVNDDNDKAYVVTKDGELMGIFVVEVDAEGTGIGSSTEGTVYLSSEMKKAGLGTIASGSKVEVNTAGRAIATFSLKAPDWAYSTKGNSASGEMTYEIYIDGVKYPGGTGTIYATADKYGDHLTSNGKGAGLTFSGSFDLTGTEPDKTERSLSRADAAGHKVSVEITAIEWNYIPIIFQMAKGFEGIDLGLPTDLWTENTTTTRLVTFNATRLIGESATATIDGATSDTDEIAAYYEFTGDDDESHTHGASWNLTPEGNKAIVVTVTPPDGYVNTYTLAEYKAKANSLRTSTFAVPDTDTSIKIVAQEGVVAGETYIQVTAETESEAPTGFYGYKVEASIKGTSIGEATITAENTKPYFSIPYNVTEDIKASDYTVKVTQILEVGPELDKDDNATVTISGKTISVKFNMDIAYRDKDGITSFEVTGVAKKFGEDLSDGSEIAIMSIKIIGDSVVYEFNKQISQFEDQLSTIVDHLAYKQNSIVSAVDENNKLKEDTALWYNAEESEKSGKPVWTKAEYNTDTNPLESN